MILRDVDSMPDFVGEFLAADDKARVAALSRGFRVRGPRGPTAGSGARRTPCA